MRDISPLPAELLGEMQSERLDWNLSLCELVDNAFDAGSPSVEIEATSKQLIVRDYGNGAAEPDRMLQRGYSTKRGSRSNVGRHGIGLKHASFYICEMNGTTKIATVCGSVLRTAFVRWGQVVDCEAWSIDDPQELEPTNEACAAYNMTKPIGTTITFCNCKRSLPSGKNLTPIIDNLRFTFAPALAGGRQIVVHSNGTRHVLIPPSPPTWSKSIDRQITVGKKTARVRAGIVAKGTQDRRRGLSYYYSHRVIVQDTSHGCGTYSTANISGTIEIGGGWTLGQNKMAITDDDWSRLGELVLWELQPLLIEASQQSDAIASSELKTKIENLINERLGRAKRPGKPKNPGAKSPKGTSRQVKRAASVGGLGSVRGNKLHGGGAISIDYRDDPLSPMFWCDVDTDRVYINRAYEFVSSRKSIGEAESLAAMAMATWAHANQKANKLACNLPGIAHEAAESQFNWAMTKLLEEQSTLSRSH